MAQAPDIRAAIGLARQLPAAGEMAVVFLRLQAVIRANHRFALLQAQIRGVAGIGELFR